MGITSGDVNSDDPESRGNPSTSAREFIGVSVYMHQDITLHLREREASHPDFDWIFFKRGHECVGTLRGVVDGNCLTIYYLLISPEFRENGYAGKVMEVLKSEFEVIISNDTYPCLEGLSEDVWIQAGFERGGNFIWKYSDQ